MSEEESIDPVSLRPDLPDFGAFLKWPISGTDWIHPEDVDQAQVLVPSNRVFRRDRWDGTYYWLHYGDQTLRVKPCMWQRTPDIDIEVGQRVEVLSKQGENDPGIFKVAEIHFLKEAQEVEFILSRDDLVISHSFRRDDFRPLEVKHHLRQGFFEHQTPKASIPEDVSMLDVGDITSSDESPKDS